LHFEHERARGSTRQVASSDGQRRNTGLQYVFNPRSLVEDFAPFRRFVCATLGKNQDLQVICEVADGPEAVQKAEELKPNLILLDIGLPTLNGTEAVRQIRKLAPESEIIFVSQQSSPDVVREALHLGARGYVLKKMAARDLLPAVEAVLKGRQFVSSGLIASSLS